MRGRLESNFLSNELPVAVLGFSGVSVGKDPPANTRDAGLIPGSGKSPGEGNGNPLQYSCLGNPMDTGAWGAIVYGVTKELDMTQKLNNNNACHWLPSFGGRRTSPLRSAK